jgi:hypothetical protein
MGIGTVSGLPTDFRFQHVFLRIGLQNKVKCRFVSLVVKTSHGFLQRISGLLGLFPGFFYRTLFRIGWFLRTGSGFSTRTVQHSKDKKNEVD